MKHNFLIISLLVVLFSGISLTYAPSSKRLVSSPPRNIRIQQIDNSLSITWKRPIRPVDGYRIYRSNAKRNLGKVLITISDPSINSFLDSSVKPNKKYYYVVRSFLSTGAESTNRVQVFKKAVKIPAQVISSDVPKKFLTLIAVNKGAESKYEDISWERTIRFKENDDIQIFEVAMWENGIPTNPNKISVYKFDRTFDPLKSEYNEGGTNWVNYRESFNILNVDVPQSCSSAQGAVYYQCSHAYLDAFKRIIETIIRNQPAEHYGIKYLGHGSDVGLFTNTFSKEDSQLLLSYFNSAIGKKLDFLDWSTNCDIGSYSVIENQYRYADYILSSDLRRGGFNIDWVNDYYKLKPEATLDKFFGPSKTIKQSLIEMVDAERIFWKTATTKTDMITQKNKQSLSIYDSSKFEELTASAHLEQGVRGDDVLDYIKQNYPSLEQKFYDFRFHYVSNIDFFPWDIASNGFKF